MNLPPSGLSPKKFQPANRPFAESYIEGENQMFEEESSVFIEEKGFTSFEDVITSDDLADEMFPPDYFMLVE